MTNSPGGYHCEPHIKVSALKVQRFNELIQGGGGFGVGGWGWVGWVGGGGGGGGGG